MAILTCSAINLNPNVTSLTYHWFQNNINEIPILLDSTSNNKFILSNVHNNYQCVVDNEFTTLSTNIIQTTQPIKLNGYNYTFTSNTTSSNEDTLKRYQICNVVFKPQQLFEYTTYYKLYNTSDEIIDDINKLSIINPGIYTPVVYNEVLTSTVLGNNVSVNVDKDYSISIIKQPYIYNTIIDESGSVVYEICIEAENVDCNNNNSITYQWCCDNDSVECSNLSTSIISVIASGVYYCNLNNGVSSISSNKITIQPPITINITSVDGNIGNDKVTDNDIPVSEFIDLPNEIATHTDYTYFSSIAIDPNTPGSGDTGSGDTGSGGTEFNPTASIMYPTTSAYIYADIKNIESALSANSSVNSITVCVTGNSNEPVNLSTLSSLSNFNTCVLLFGCSDGTITSEPGSSIDLDKLNKRTSKPNVNVDVDLTVSDTIDLWLDGCIIQSFNTTLPNIIILNSEINSVINVSSSQTKHLSTIQCSAIEKNNDKGGVINVDCGSLYCNCCVFENNSAEICGGAIYVCDSVEASSNIIIESSIFKANRVTTTETKTSSSNANGSGGAIAIEQHNNETKFNISSCLFDGNSATYAGCAINYIVSSDVNNASSLTIEKCQFSNNSAIVSSAAGIINNTKITYPAGGVINIIQSSSNEQNPNNICIKSCGFYKNVIKFHKTTGSANLYGVIICKYSKLYMENCAFYNLSSTHTTYPVRGIIAGFKSQIDAYHCTFANNENICNCFINYDSKYIIKNALFANNTFKTLGSTKQANIKDNTLHYTNTASAITYENCLISPSNSVNIDSKYPTVSGCTDAQLAMNSALSSSNNIQYYDLSSISSPALFNAKKCNNIETDIIGRTRDNKTSFGAVECVSAVDGLTDNLQNVCYVDGKYGWDGNTGESWLKPYKTLQKALSTNALTIQLAETVTVESSTPLNITKDTTLVGGFSSYYGENDVQYTDMECYTQFVLQNNNITVKLHNLDIKNNTGKYLMNFTKSKKYDIELVNCNYSDNTKGIFTDVNSISGNLKIQNCKFETNKLSTSILINVTSPYLTLDISGCEFYGCSASYYIINTKCNTNINSCVLTGCSITTNEYQYGAIVINNISARMSINNTTISSCTVVDNGVVNIINGVGVLSNVTFENCFATKQQGGAIHIYKTDGNNLSAIGCTFTGCTSLSGGAIFNYYASVIIINSKFINCSASQYGGAIYDYTSDYLYVSGCTFKNCSATRTGGAIYLNGNSKGGSIHGNTYTTNVSNDIYVNISSNNSDSNKITISDSNAVIKYKGQL